MIVKRPTSGVAAEAVGMDRTSIDATKSAAHARSPNTPRVATAGPDTRFAVISSVSRKEGALEMPVAGETVEGPTHNLAGPCEQERVCAGVVGSDGTQTTFS